MHGLQLRVYKRGDKKHIDNICFIPPKVHEYIDKYGNMELHVYVERRLSNIYDSPMKDLYFDLGTDKDKIKLAFADNWHKGDKKHIEVGMPIKFVDFIYKIFDHFDEVGLVGYPDNGGIDCVSYDEKAGVYMVGTWT